MTSLLRACAEHESAHAVVSAHFGLAVTEVRVSPGGAGRTVHEAGGTALQECAITAAGDLWAREFGTPPYVDLGCTDLAQIERAHGLGALWPAERVARQILIDRRRAVLALADRLVSERVIIFNGSQRGRGHAFA